MAAMPEPAPGGAPQYAPVVRLTLSLKGQHVQSYTFDKPGVYVLRLRVAHRVAVKLRDAMRAKFRLRTALRGAVGNNSTSSVTPVTLLR